jgi:hypothetical protein
MLLDGLKELVQDFSAYHLACIAIRKASLLIQQVVIFLVNVHNNSGQCPHSSQTWVVC